MSIAPAGSAGGVTDAGGAAASAGSAGGVSVVGGAAASAGRPEIVCTRWLSIRVDSGAANPTDDPAAVGRVSGVIRDSNEGQIIPADRLGGADAAGGGVITGEPTPAPGNTGAPA